jgi:hypothetical protein
VWRFGHAVRNALIHNGCIHFTSRSSPAVEWRGLRYGFVDNGRPVLFKELTGVELILLMEEMDVCLRRVRGDGTQPRLVLGVRLGWGHTHLAGLQLACLGLVR